MVVLVAVRPRVRWWARGLQEAGECATTFGAADRPWEVAVVFRRSGLANGGRAGWRVAGGDGCSWPMNAAALAFIALLVTSSCERRSRSQHDDNPPPSSSAAPSRPPSDGEIELTRLMENLLATIQAGHHDEARAIVAGFKIADCKAWFESRFQNTAGDRKGSTITGDERIVGELVSECVEQGGRLEQTMVEKIQSALEKGWNQVQVESFSTPMDPAATMTQGEALRFARVPIVLYSVRMSGPAGSSPSLHLFSFVRDEDHGTKYAGRMTGATLLFRRGLQVGAHSPPAEGLYWRRSEYKAYLSYGVGPNSSNDTM